MNKEFISVILPVYNAEKYLSASISSIINQTYKYFELIIINDGSTDGSLEVINKFTDSRIKVVTHDSNLGLIDTLNEGIKISKGNLIARMDADDISLKTRFEKQVNYMNLNKNIGICSTWYKLIENRKVIKKEETDPSKLKCKLLFSCPLAHPAVMMRKEILNNERMVYSKNFPHAEDYELWIRLTQFTQISNYPEILLLYRHSPEQVSQKYKLIQRNSIMKAQKELFEQLGLYLSTGEFDVQKKLFFQEFLINHKFVIDCENWLLKIKHANIIKKIFDEKVLDEILFKKWYMVCSHLTSKGIKTKKAFFNSELFNKRFFSLKFAVKFNIKNLKHGL